MRRQGDEDDDDDDDDYENENEDDDDDENDDEDDDENEDENDGRKTRIGRRRVRKRRVCCVCRDRLGFHRIHSSVFGRTHVQLIGNGSTTVTLKRYRKMRLDPTATFGQGDVICRACAALTFTDFLVSVDDVRFANVLEDERKLLLLAEHLRTNPETIARDPKVELAGWGKTPSSPERSIKVGCWLYSVCKRHPRRLQALEKSPNDDVKKATAEVLRLTSEFQDCSARPPPRRASSHQPRDHHDAYTEVELAGWGTPVVSGALERKSGLGFIPFAKTTLADSKRSRNRPTTDVKKATAEVLRLTSDFQDARRVLLLAEHLRTNPETITRYTEVKLAGWKTPSSPVRSTKVGAWFHSVCKYHPRRLEALEKSRFDDVKKATAEVLRLTSDFQDARRVLLLAEHLRTNPETITTRTEIELAGWKTPSSPVRSIKVGCWLYSVCKHHPRRLEALEKSRFDDVKKATAEVCTHVKASLISYRH